jgi:hypothetical protein
MEEVKSILEAEIEVYGGNSLSNQGVYALLGNVPKWCLLKMIQNKH